MAKKASRSMGQRVRVSKSTGTNKPINYSSRLTEFNRNTSYDPSCSSCVDNVWHHAQLTKEEN